MINRSLIVLIILLISGQVWATHNRAGEITYRHLGGFTYEATITTYTVPDSPADRPDLPLGWGDGTLDTLFRVNGPGQLGEIIATGIKMNKYVGIHTYASASTYCLSMEDPNRNGGVINIPNSVDVPFYIQSCLTISPFFGNNSSPILLNPPIDLACVGEIFEHNPGAYDLDGDSLSYELVTCFGADGLEIEGYTIPAGVTIDQFTGTMSWIVPLQQGEFNYAIQISEWRNGVLVGYVLRDLQVNVLNCDNDPPIIETIDEICVEAGDSVGFLVTAYDPNGDNVRLTATGGPLEVTDSATFAQPVYADTARSYFHWDTECHHVQVQPYTMVFRAEDDPPSNQPELVDYHTVLITVVGPAPENPTATPQGNEIDLNWEASICQEVTGYKIYRRIEEYGFIHDTCETGVPAYTGYMYIGSTTGLNATSFTDNGGGNGLLRGNDYCYMVVACFADNGGAESYASVEFCAELKRDLPIITNVSVRNTDPVNGSMDVVWSAPTELDFAQVPGPHEYHLYRADNGGGADLQIATLFELNDTIFVDTLMNTQELEFTYRVELFNAENGNEFTVGSSDPANSVFITTTGGDNTITISWNESVPWINDNYEVYRQEPDLSFLLLGTVSEQSYTDTGLANGVEFCYKIQSIGHFSIDSIIDPVLNWSQISCTEPIDTFPPCPQTLMVEPDCDELQNLITWENPDGCPDDIVEYQLYYTPVMNGEMELISTTSSNDPSSFDHIELVTSIAGCYSLAAVDSFQNTSMSDTVCVDNCVEYELPNVFTPNGDGFNQLFEPFPYRFIDHIDMTIYDRWGLIMFETEDPAILWDGTSKQTGSAAPDGVYYYTATVFEIRLEGIVERNLHGYVHILASHADPPN